MGLFLIIVVVFGAMIFARLEDAFRSNVILNGLILVVLLIGIIRIFAQVFGLVPALSWLRDLQQETAGRVTLPSESKLAPPPRILAPMASLLGDRRGRITLSAISLRTLMDGIQSRIEESHEISRYLIGLLIFLGLLGTFWGLLETVTAVGDTITGLSAGAGDAGAFFEDLKRGLETPLSGMGTAFSSSLFGLAGSLILGFLELQASQAHNRFLNTLEEWLSSKTRLSGGGAIGEGDQTVPAYIQALLEKTADSLDQLQHTIMRGESDRGAVNTNLSALVERLAAFTDQMSAERELLVRLSDTQNQMKSLLASLSQERSGGVQGLDEATKTHIRNMDARMEQMASEIASGRQHAVLELRSEIRLLTRTIAAMAEESPDA
jgi:biopolymer transport protein ExbB/TolQ